MRLLIFCCCVLVLVNIKNTYAQPVPRIINGRPASVSVYPWLGDLDGCAGTLIAPQWVLTAAHCFRNANGSAVDLSLEHRLPAQFLSDNILQVSPDVIEVKGIELIPYPDYDPKKGFEHDIALLRLAEPIHHIPVVTLMGTHDIADNLPAAIIGRGATAVNDDNQPINSSEILLKANLFTVSNAACHNIYRREGQAVTDNMVCLGGFSADDSSSTCKGDSGGPSFIETEDGEVMQIGVISFGGSTRTRICGNPDLPSVSTRVSRYRDWIEQHVPEAHFAMQPANNIKFPESCKTQIDPNLNVFIPCLVFENQVYSTHLWLVDTVNLNWLWSGQIVPSACPVNTQSCVSVDQELTLTIRDLLLDGKRYRATLHHHPAFNEYGWNYHNHEIE